MSYVLEALRRADAERHSGAVPGLDAQPLPPPQGEAPARARPNRWWAWLALAATGVAGVLWVLAQRPAAAPAPASLTAVPPAAPTATAALAARATDAPAPHVADPPAVPGVAAQPVPPMPVSRLPPEPRPAATLPAPATASAGAAAAVLPLASLPEALRRQIPPLAFGGATDSPSAASRMLIINGQLFREGDEPAPGLVLERIALRSAQMRFRGQRFEVAY